ncbi:GAF and ANTAR domain-containing protein [Streptomyces sp. NPDC005899]|uniref:GAF and ANTAR domain-containing protein n=1 Tax=Streptomyces sp. NPDC005899 TaxID=3155716 RepID=UPI0033D1BFE1
MSAEGPYDSGRVTQWLLDTESLEHFLQTLADAALEPAPCEGVGVTLERDGRPITVVSAGRAGPKPDEKQYGQDDGPCLRALRGGEEITVREMLHEARWGDYPSYAVSCGIRCSLSLPIAARTHTAGALNLYAASPDAFADADHLAALRTLAAQATGGIALAQRISDTQESAGQMETAMRSRGVIDQALGIVMGEHRCTADEAFGVLRSASQHRNINSRPLWRVGGRRQRPTSRGTRVPAPPMKKAGARRGEVSSGRGPRRAACPASASSGRRARTGRCDRAPGPRRAASSGRGPGGPPGGRWPPTGTGRSCRKRRCAASRPTSTRERPVSSSASTGSAAAPKRVFAGACRHARGAAAPWAAAARSTWAVGRSQWAGLVESTRR